MEWLLELATSTLQVATGRPASVTGATARATLAGLKAAAEGWWWDPAQQLTHVKLPAATSARTVTLNGVDKAAYEAEFATGTGTSTNTDHPGYTGTGFVDGFASSGDAVTFDVKADAAGQHQLRFRYATTVAAGRTVYVDGTPIGTLSLPSTGSWDTWGTATLTTSLSAGAHTVRIASSTPPSRSSASTPSDVYSPAPLKPGRSSVLLLLLKRSG